MASVGGSPISSGRSGDKNGKLPLEAYTWNRPAGFSYESSLHKFSSHISAMWWTRRLGVGTAC